jgi:hypothetical protein
MFFQSGSPLGSIKQKIWMENFEGEDGENKVVKEYSKIRSSFPMHALSSQSCTSFPDGTL